MLRWTKTVSYTHLDVYKRQGLSIVKHVAAFHHAQIKMESEPGVGTSICVEFPATFESVPVRERG